MTSGGPALGRSWSPVASVIVGSAWVTLKQHRIEVGAGVVAAIVVGISAFVVTWRLNGVAMPPGCFDAWFGTPGVTLAAGCARAIALWTTIRDDEAAWVYRALGLLPLVGLLAGVPLVGRELEARTAQVAWSLSASRTRWLVRQVVPVALLLIASTTFAAIGADALQATQRNSEVQNLPFHGPILVARTIGALAIGVLAGAVSGRTLPAFVVGLAACFLLAAGAVPPRIAWLDGQKSAVGPVRAYWYSYGVMWRGPDGALISEDAAFALAARTSDDFDQQQTWLTSHGFEQVQLAVTDEAAKRWIPYETALWTALGLAAVSGAAIVTNRRRPS